MKNKLWLLQLPLVLLFTFAFFVSDQGVQGRLDNPFLRERIFPKLRSVSGMFTDLKFRLRGTQSPKNKVVIVEIDSLSLEQLGRWPWHRDVTGILVDKIFSLGAKVVGLDMVFSEPDRRVDPEFQKVLDEKGLKGVAEQFETDPILESVIAKYSDRLVLSWTSESLCQPLYGTGKDVCPVMDPEMLALFPKDIDRFTYPVVNAPQNFDPMKTPVMSLVSFIANIPQYNAVARYQGYFNADPDPDGYIRRTPLLYLGGGKPYPSLPLMMAAVGTNDLLSVSFGKDHRVSSVNFMKSAKQMPVTPVGVVEINFRGGGRTFPYISAYDVLTESDKFDDPVNHKFTGVSKREFLQDAYVLVGPTALGVFDMRHFPFESNVAGVEGHATILDNILAGDFLTRGQGVTDPRWIYLLMVAGAIAFAFFTQKLESVPALLLFLFAFGGFGGLDLFLLFKKLNVNWDTSFLYLEMFSIFIFTLAAKYVLEERNKKFVKGAFAKYVAPAVVDSILKDPAKLTVGGEKRELTIMFSDIRGFTTFSERMDAKALSSFLNDYLSIQTEIVFKNHGTLDKYIGDAIMAFWGAPLDDAKHAYHACKAAREMMQALEANKERFLQQYGVEVNIGIGLNSGVVSVGNMGSVNNFAYTVIGDHVNLASRLEGLTKYYASSIVTSRFTYDCMAAAGVELLPHRTLDFVKVKGKKKAVELIQVLDRDYDAKGLALFEEARVLYSQQKWDEAIQKFLEANALLAPSPEQMDGPTEMYLERCEEFKKNPPAADWDGSWEMHSK